MELAQHLSRSHETQREPDRRANNTGCLTQLPDDLFLSAPGEKIGLSYNLFIGQTKILRIVYCDSHLVFENEVISIKKDHNIALITVK